MGYLKNLMIEQLEKGYQFMEEKYVCHYCFEDYAVKAFIKNNSVRNHCDYCRRTSRRPIAAFMIDVLDFIMEGVNTEWDDPVNCVGWEGGWVGAEVYDSYDMIHDDMWELDIQEETLKADLLEAFSHRQWCEIDPYGLRLHEELYYDWERFCKQIKHQVRFVFFRIPKSRFRSYSLEDRKNPFKILYDLGEITKDLGLIKMIPVGTEVFRCRTHKKTEKLRTVQELGPPLPEEAKYSNRMSPAGIPMFYGSQDGKTAIAETLTRNEKSKTHVTIAKFRTLKAFKVLDLTKLPEVPSLFDDSKRHLRPPIMFLHSFLRDFSKPIKKDGREHYEYAPTQVVTEYFRHVFRDVLRDAIKGVVYPSSATSSKSYVLFFQQKNCIQDDESMDGNKWLSMDTASVKTKSINKLKY
jgi:hypothetical protein